MLFCGSFTSGSAYRSTSFTFLYIFILIGLVGEYLAFTYEEVQRRPIYLLDQLVNFGDTPAIDGPNGSLLPVPTDPSADI